MGEAITRPRGIGRACAELPITPCLRSSQNTPSRQLLSPTQRRAAVEHVRRRLGVSERLACRAIGQPRSTQRYVGRPKAEWDRWLVERMEIGRAHV